jgi:transposase
MLKEKRPKEKSNIFCDSSYIYNTVLDKKHILRGVKEQIDFSFLRKKVEHLYKKDFGRPAVAPETIGKLSFLQFYYNLSDRQMEQAAGENIAFKYFLDMEVEAPPPCDATTLSKVRSLWGEETFRAYFEEIVEQAKKQGIIGNRRMVDSTKILMNCAVVRYLKMVRRLGENLLKALEEVVPTPEIKELQRDKKQLEQETSWWLSQELKEAYYGRWYQFAQRLLEWTEEFLQKPGQAAELACWEKKKKDIEKFYTLLKRSLEENQNRDTRGGGKKNKKKKDRLVSDVDEDARYSADNKGRVKAGYKGHLSVDVKSEIITALAVTRMNIEDGKIVLPLVEDENKRGLELKELGADTAYSDGEIRKELQDKQIESFIPEPKPKPSSKNKFISQQFQFNENKGEIICPAGKHSGKGRKTRQGDYRFYFHKQQCEQCRLKEKCLAERELNEGVRRGRTVYVNKYRPLHEKAHKKQETVEFKKAMIQRLSLERKNAELLIRHNLRRARYRTLPKVSIEVLLAATVMNIKKMVKLKNEEVLAVN